MNATRERLLTCFSLVFAGKSPEQLALADIDNLPEWDSSNHILLMQVIAEQFGSPIPDDAMGELTSFAAVELYLNREGSH
jgi:hypothetical protein